MVMPIELVDFHCHLDLYPDHATTVAECEKDGVFTLAVTTTPRAWPRNYELTSGLRRVRAALGLHPQLVEERASEIAIFEKYLSQARYVGEVGLDAGPRFYKSLDLQKQVFERVLRACAQQGGKILTVHSVRAAKAVLDMVEVHLPSASRRVVLHWFTGSQAEARRAVELGCYFSVNTEMLRNERHRAMVAALPLNRLLTETDGPFTQHEGRTARPRDVYAVVETLARLRNTSTTHVVAAIRSNLRVLVSAGESSEKA
jgi:TatD DNase family protein